MSATAPAASSNTHILNGRAIRPSAATVRLHGVDVDCLFVLDGVTMAPTEVDADERPVVVLLEACIDRVDVMRLFAATGLDSDVVEAIYAQWENGNGL